MSPVQGGVWCLLGRERGFSLAPFLKARKGKGALSPTAYYLIAEGGMAGCTDSCSQSKLQWQKVLSSPNLWTDMTLILH